MILTLAIMATGCGSTEDQPLAKKPVEHVGRTAQALVPSRVSCNQDSPTITVVAQNMGTQANPRYRGSVSDLLSELSLCALGPPGDAATACADQYNYTQAIYDVPGAAGYYYRVADTNAQGVTHYWITLPITDNTTVSPRYYYTYPGPGSIHTPAFATPPVSGGTPRSDYPFWLCDNDGPCGRWDHTDLWNVVQSSLNTANVGGQVKNCAAIVDPANNFLDYTAEIEEHDPNGCGGCSDY
jgi:hypothetical protein